MTASHPDSFGARATLEVGGRALEVFRLEALQERFDVARLPFSLKILLENLLRTEDGTTVSAQDIEALANWDPAGPASIEIAFTPSRVLMQDFTGVPAIVDLAAMRDAMEQLGGDPKLINPLVPVELVIDHSRRRTRRARAPAHPPRAPVRNPVRSRSTCSASRAPSSATPSWSSSATASATRSGSGVRRRSTTARW